MGPRNRTALITGVNSGLGFEASAQLAEAGFIITAGIEATVASTLVGHHQLPIGLLGNRPSQRPRTAEARVNTSHRCICRSLPRGRYGSRTLGRLSERQSSV